MAKYVQNNFSCQHSWFLTKIVYAWEGDEKEIVPTVEKEKRRRHRSSPVGEYGIEHAPWWRSCQINIREFPSFLKRNLRISLIMLISRKLLINFYPTSSSTANNKSCAIFIDGFGKLRHNQSLADIVIHQVPKRLRLLPSTASLLLIKSARQDVMLSHLEIACGFPIMSYRNKIRASCGQSSSTFGNNWRERSRRSDG